MVMTHFTSRDEVAVFICSHTHIFNFNDTSSNDSQLSLRQMKWDSITSQRCQSRDIFYSFSDSRTCLCMPAIFEAILGARPSQWSVGAPASGGETQTSWDSDTSGEIWVKESLAVIFGGIPRAARLSGALPSLRALGEMTVRHLWDENSPRRIWDLVPRGTWQFTQYLLPLFFFLSLASTYMRDALFWDFPDFLSPVSVGCCCYGKERESVFPWSSPSCTSSSSCTLSNQIQNITTCMKVRRGLASAYITGLLSPLSSFRRLRSSIQAVITESHLRPGSECPAVSGWSCKKCFCSCVERFLFFCALCCKLSYRQETAQERWFWSFGYKEIFQNHSIHRIKHFVYGRPKLKTHN